jgi:hypothetical protein
MQRKFAGGKNACRPLAGHYVTQQYRLNEIQMCDWWINWLCGKMDSSVRLVKTGGFG